MTGPALSPLSVHMVSRVSDEASTSWREDSHSIRAYDGALPPALFNELQSGFGENASYWKENEPLKHKFHSWWVSREHWKQAGALGIYFEEF